MAITVAQLMAEVGVNIAPLVSGLAKADSALKATEGTADKTAKNIEKSFEGLSRIGARMSLLVTTPIVAAAGASFHFAANLTDSMSKADTIFGKNSAAVKAWSQTTLKGFGVGQRAALDAASGFQGTFEAAGVSAAQATEMTKRLVERAGDLKSIHNLDSVGSALQKIQSGLVGESEPLRAVNILLSEAAVKREAVASGLAKEGEELTEATKAIARYNIILAQSSKTQGDFAKTAGDPNNQISVLTQRFEKLSAELGQRLIPHVLKFISAINGLLDRLESMPPWLQNLMLAGVGIAAGAGPALQGIGGAAMGLKALGAFGGIGGAAAGAGAGAAGLGLGVPIAGAVVTAAASTAIHNKILTDIATAIGDNSFLKGVLGSIPGGSVALLQVEANRLRSKITPKAAGTAAGAAGASGAPSALGATSGAAGFDFTAGDGVFTLLKARADAWLAGSDEDTAAFEKMKTYEPLLKARMVDLEKQAEFLAKSTKPEDAAKLISVQAEWWGAQESITSMRVAAANEEAKNIEKGWEDQEKIVKAQKEAWEKWQEQQRNYISAYYGLWKSKVAQAVGWATDETKAAAELEAALPMLASLQADALAKMNSFQQGTTEWMTAQKEAWDIQSEIDKLRIDVVKEQADNQKKSADAAKKAADEQKRLYDEIARDSKRAVDELIKTDRDRKSMFAASSSLVEAQLKTRGMLGMGGRQQAQAMLPFLVEQFGSMSQAAIGESPLERMSRLTEREGLGQKILGMGRNLGYNPRAVAAQLSGFGDEMASYNTVHADFSEASSHGKGTIINITIPPGTPPAEIAAILQRQLESLQRQGSYGPMTPG